MIPSDAVVVSPDLDAQKSLGGLLVRCGLAPIAARTANEAETILSNYQVSVVLSSEELPDGSFGDILRISKNTVRRVPVIVFSPLADWERYLTVLHAGAFDYIPYPPPCGELQRVVLNALSHAFLENARAVLTA